MMANKYIRTYIHIFMPMFIYIFMHISCLFPCICPETDIAIVFFLTERRIQVVFHADYCLRKIKIPLKNVYCTCTVHKTSRLQRKLLQFSWRKQKRLMFLFKKSIIYDVYLVNCMFLSSHVPVSERIHTLQLPECQANLFSKQTRYLKFKLLQRDSNPQPLSSHA